MFVFIIGIDHNKHTYTDTLHFMKAGTSFLHVPVFISFHSISFYLRDIIPSFSRNLFLWDSNRCSFKFLFPFYNFYLFVLLLLFVVCVPCVESLRIILHIKLVCVCISFYILILYHSFLFAVSGISKLCGFQLFAFIYSIMANYAYTSQSNELQVDLYNSMFGIVVC